MWRVGSWTRSSSITTGSGDQFQNWTILDARSLFSRRSRFSWRSTALESLRSWLTAPLGKFRPWTMNQWHRESEKFAKIFVVFIFQDRTCMDLSKPWSGCDDRVLCAGLRLWAWLRRWCSASFWCTTSPCTAVHTQSRGRGGGGRRMSWGLWFWRIRIS